MSRTTSIRVLLAAAVCLPCLTGCFKVTTVLKVNRDGSGTLVETTGISEQTLQQLEAMVSGFAQGMGAEAKPADGLLSEDSFKTKAGSYGPGVKLLGFKKTQEGDWVQATATYAAKDVTKIRLSSSNQPDMPGQQKQEGAPPYLFRLRKLPGGLTELTIKIPPPKPAPPEAGKPTEDNAAGAEQPDQQMPPEMLQMFKDLEITVAVECGSEIVETNATHVEGNRVTLVHFAFGKLLENQDKLKELAKLGPAARDLETIKPLLKGIEGMQFELEPKVVAKFR
jgi:hypothetical protein